MGPLDAIEIGSKPMKTGEIRPVKVLGVLAMIDDGETDWKLIVARVDDPDFYGINTLVELEASKYGSRSRDSKRRNIIGKIRHWLTHYKTPDDTKPNGVNPKKRNKFGFGGRPEDEKYALGLVDQTHAFWARKTHEGEGPRELGTKVFSATRRTTWDEQTRETRALVM